MENNYNDIIAKIKFNQEGLVPAIAQSESKEVLMMAWMNENSIIQTFETGYIHYHSRSRKKLWKKGETSGHVQRLQNFALDCDFDTILLTVKQVGVACHTGRRNCFFNQIIKGKIIEK